MGGGCSGRCKCKECHVKNIHRIKHLLDFGVENLAIKERHWEIASSKNRVMSVIQEGRNLNMFPSQREKFFREKRVNNFRAEMIDCQSSPGDHGSPITRGLALDGKSFHSFE